MKKFKLFTTIASLCLAVALMAFGVYAATQATIGVSSNIQYTVKGNIGGILTVKSYASTDGKTDSFNTETATAMETFTATVNATMTDSEAGALTATEATQKDSTFDANNKYVIYVVEFNETTNENVELQVSSITLKEGVANTTKISCINGLENKQPAKTSESINQYYIVVHLEDALNADTTFTVEFSVNVTKGA